MGFMDKLGSAANLAKWKADQQMRLMRAQNAIHDMEKQINTQKASLADAALELYAQGGLAEERLNGICAAIGQLHVQLTGLNDNLRQIQSEQPPADGQPAPAPAPAAAAPAPVVPLTPVAQDAPPPAPQAAALYCPVCGQELKGKFCPEDGVAGVAR